MADKRLKGLRKELEAQGFEVAERSGKWLVYPPDPDAHIVTIHLTESDHRAFENSMSRLKQAGFIRRR